MAMTKKPVAKKQAKTATKTTAAKKVSKGSTKKALIPAACCSGGVGLTKK